MPILSVISLAQVKNFHAELGWRGHPETKLDITRNCKPCMLQFAIAQHSPASSQPGCHCNRFALHAPGSQHGTFGAFTGTFGFSGVGSSGFRGKALALSFAGTAMHRLGVAFFLRIFTSALRELGTFLSGGLKPKGLEKTWAAFELSPPPQGLPCSPLQPGQDTLSFKSTKSTHCARHHC